MERLIARLPAGVSTNPGEPKVKVTYYRGDRGFLNLWDCVREERKVHCLAATERTVGIVDVGVAGEQVENDASRILSSAGERLARPGTVMQ